MLDIKVYRVINNETENVFMNIDGVEQDVFFSAESMNKVLEQNPDEKDIRLRIHCDGGSTEEGFAIYDILRTSGRNIYANIDGGCHSMATILLLAAAKENRSANPNARALIHEVRGGAFGTAEEMRAQVELVEQEQQRILDIYAERTGWDRAELEAMMKEEKFISAQDLLKYGFISKINSYSTNQKTNPMAKITDSMAKLLGRVDSLITKATNLLDDEGPKNYTFTDADGAVLFSTEKEDDSIAVGDAAKPDGVFTLQDGRTVTIAEGVITEIKEKEQAEDTAALQEQVTNLTAENESLRNALTETKNLLTEVRNQLGSNYKPANRVVVPGAKNRSGAVKSFEDIKTEAREKREQMKGGLK